MTKYFNGEASPRTSDMIRDIHDDSFTIDGGFGLRIIRKVIDIDMKGWKEFKTKRLTDWDAYSMGYGREYKLLHKFWKTHTPPNLIITSDDVNECFFPRWSSAYDFMVLTMKYNNFDIDEYNKFLLFNHFFYPVFEGEELEGYRMNPDCYEKSIDYCLKEHE